MHFSQPPLSAPILQGHFLPAVLKEYASGWIIEYYVEDPISKKLIRKQIRLERIIRRYNCLKDSRRHINRMIAVINLKLQQGWNPLFEGEDARLYTKLADCIDVFLAEKEKELRIHTLRSYKSFCNILLKWVNNNVPGILASMFTQSIAVRYMDYIYHDRNVNAVSYNNTIKTGRSFYNWLKEKCYVKDNPFEKLKLKRKQEKKRILVPIRERKLIADYLIENNKPTMLTVLKLMYTSLIRPKEIQLIQLKHIHLDEKYISIPGRNAKNHHERFAAISKSIIEDLQRLNLDRYPPDYFLFGISLYPSKEPCGYARFRKEWDKIRESLKLPQEMQLYSLRDTGINEMIKSGIDDLSVMQHADHSSLDMTTRYANHADPHLVDVIYNKAPSF